jgi:hypothetical protein
MFFFKYKVSTECVFVTQLYSNERSRFNELCWLRQIAVSWAVFISLQFHSVHTLTFLTKFHVVLPFFHPYVPTTIISIRDQTKQGSILSRFVCHLQTKQTLQYLHRSGNRIHRNTFSTKAVTQGAHSVEKQCTFYYVPVAVLAPPPHQLNTVTRYFLPITTAHNQEYVHTHTHTKCPQDATTDK